MFTIEGLKHHLNVAQEYRESGDHAGYLRHIDGAIGRLREMARREANYMGSWSMHHRLEYQDDIGQLLNEALACKDEYELQAILVALDSSLHSHLFQYVTEEIANDPRAIQLLK